MAMNLQNHPEERNEDSFSWTGITVEQLAKACEEAVEDKTNSTLDCFSYMDGFLDGYALTALSDNNQSEFCLPKNPPVSKKTIAKMFVYLAKKPDISQDPAFLILSAMLSQVFPCDE